MKALKFEADWCTNCKTQSAIIEKAEGLISMPIEHIDLDENRDMARDFRVRSIPTLIIVDENDIEVKRHIGVLKQEDLLKFLEV